MKYSSAIHQAALLGDVEQVAKLLARDRYLIHAREKDDTPLHCASTLAVARLLLERGTKVNARGWMGRTPLHCAAERGDIDVARLLIQYRAEVNAGRDRNDTPLHWAADAAFAQLLIEHGARVEAQDEMGRRPLHWAAARGRHEVVAVLIKHGADVHARDTSGSTPLHEAAMGIPLVRGSLNTGHMIVARLLIEAGAEINAQEERTSFTPLHGAIFRAWLIERENEDMVCLLLDMGADIYARNAQGQTPLHMAKGKMRLVQVLNRYSEAAGPPPPVTPDHFELELVRAHPRRLEAVTTIKNALLARWVYARAGHPPHLAASVQTPYARINAIAITPNGETIAVAPSEEIIEFRRWDDLSLVSSVSTPFSGGASAMALAVNGRWLALADLHESIHLLDRSTGTPLAKVDGGEYTSTVLFSPSSRLLASACSFQGGGYIRIDRVNEQGQLTPVSTLERSSVETPASVFVDTLVHMAFSPDSRLLALFESSSIYHSAHRGGWRGDIALYAVEKGSLQWQTVIDARVTGDTRSLQEAGYPMGFLTELLFVSKTELVCGATSGLLLLYDVASGKLTRRVSLESPAAVRSLAMNSKKSALWIVLADGKLVSLSLR